VREFTMVYALMHLPQEQFGIQLIAIRIVEHPFNRPRTYVFDHFRLVASCLSENVFRDVRPRAHVPFDHSVVLKMSQTRNEERSGDARQSPPEIIETAAAKK
jgi:hypothetical protein